MRNLTLKISVLEEGMTTKEIAVSVVAVGAESKQKCQPVVFIKDTKSGFETTVKLPSGEHCSLWKFLEDIADKKLDAMFVLGFLRKIGSLFEIH